MATISKGETVRDDLKVIDAKYLEQLKAYERISSLLSLPPIERLTPGLILRIYRATHNITAIKLSEISKLSRAQIRNIEKDKHDPQFETIEKLSKIFGEQFKEVMIVARGNTSRSNPIQNKKE